MNPFPVVYNVSKDFLVFLGFLTLNCRTKSCNSARVMLSSGRCGGGVGSLGTTYSDLSAAVVLVRNFFSPSPAQLDCTDPLICI